MKKALFTAWPLLLCLTGCGGTGTSSAASSPTSSAEMVEYHFTISNTMEYGIKGLNLSLGEGLTGRTNVKGQATIEAPKDGVSSLAISNLGGYIFEGLNLEKGKYDYELTLQSLPNKDPIDSSANIGIGGNVYDFTLQRDDGIMVNLTEAMKGKKGAIINCWYITCPYCLEEFPSLNSEAPALKDDYAFFAISKYDDHPSIAKFKEAYHYDNLDFYNDQTGFLTSMKISTFPTTILINPQGLIVNEMDEPLEDGAFTTYVKENLG